MTTLRNATIIGYFSIPSPSLAELNPAAYANSCRDLPPGAGSCSQCGMGILHHVVIRDADGIVRFVGRDCAEKVGVDPEALRYRQTAEQRAAYLAQREAKQNAAAAAAAEKAEQVRIFLALRRESVGDLIDLLRAQGTDFHSSLADQLAYGPLSERQAFFVAKLLSATGRRNRQNAAAWDDCIDRCMYADEH